MSQHWSSPLDDYTQEYHVLEVPQELLSELSDDISAGIQRCRQRESAELIKVSMFLSSLDRVVTSMGDVHTTVCVQDQADGNSIKCSSTIDICNLLLWEWQSRGKCTDIAITLVMKAWLDIDIGSEFHVFVLDSAIRGRQLTVLYLLVIAVLTVYVSSYVSFQRSSSARQRATRCPWSSASSSSAC